jgi:hypothetical protein
MATVSRRTFVTGSASAAGAFAFLPTTVLAAPQCVSSYLPARLTVDCASRQNFQIFRQYSAYVGLAGIVSMTAIVSKVGRYPAGNLFLFPCLKVKGRAPVFKAYFPTSTAASNTTAPGLWGAPRDEYLCRTVLQAAPASFIGVEIDVPFGTDRASTPRFSNIAGLPDGQPLGINWTSSTLNHRHFAGSRLIPANGVCSGETWRKLIIDGLKLAAGGVCA